MNIASTAALIVLGTVAIGAVLFYHGSWFTTAAVISAPTVQQMVNEDSSAVRAQVVAFGSVMKNVSLLAPATELTSEMETQYAAYLTPELLGVWELDPTKALGRRVSSPWPDHIDIESMAILADGTYQVDGHVVEISSADSSLSLAATYPVTLYLTKRNGVWLIASVMITTV